MENKILNDKYRPADFDEVVGLNPEIPKLVNQGMPHMLFYGPQGTGKTSVAKLIIKKLEADTLFLNGSKDRGIDILRDVIEPFARKSSDKIKIIFIDEAEYLTINTQSALRSFLETYSGNTRFIFTCNYLSKIISPLSGRFSKFNFQQYNDSDIKTRLLFVINQENIKISDDAVDMLIKKFHDDIRDMINFLNTNKSKEIKKEDISNDNTILKILSQLKNDKWFDIRNELLNQSLDYNSLIEEMESLIFNHKDIPMNVKMKTNSLAQKYQFEMNFSFNKELCFAAFMCEMQSVLKW